MLEKRWIHIDLKGLCPSVPFLIKSLERFCQMGANGFLFEIEDMFPFNAAAQSVRPDCYSDGEWKEIAEACAGLNTDFVPMVQTLGHLQWLLWHDDFADLRAIDEKNKGVSQSYTIYQVNPCDKKAIKLIISLIDEIIDFKEDLKYLHIGGDETWFEGDDPGEAYLRHMTPILQHIIDRGIIPMIWSDMILSYYRIIDRLPEETVITDWMYSHRSQFGEKPEIWGEKEKLFAELSPGRQKEFGEHIFRGLEYGGGKKHHFPYPSYFKAKSRPVMVVPAGQCWGDRFSMPTLFWKFDNARAYCKEGFECGALGAINSDWIIRRNMRELTRICHFGFLRNAADPENQLSNREILCAYWDDISPGSGEQAADIFTPVCDIRSSGFDGSAPVAHNLKSQYWSVGSLMDRLEKDPNRPGDPGNDRLISDMKCIRETGCEISGFCTSLLEKGLTGEKEAETRAWLLAGEDMSFRAEIWFFMRDLQQGKQVKDKTAKLISAAEELKTGFASFWKGRYQKKDIELETAWRFDEVIDYLQQIL